MLTARGIHPGGRDSGKARFRPRYLTELQGSKSSNASCASSYARSTARLGRPGGLLVSNKPFHVVDHLVKILIAGDIQKSKSQTHALESVRPARHCAILVQDCLDLGLIVL